MNERWKKAIRNYRRTATWYVVGRNSGLHLFGNAPSTFSTINGYWVILARTHEEAVYRAVKRWSSVKEFNYINDRPHEVSRKWCRYSVILRSEVGRKIQKTQYYE